MKFILCGQETMNIGKKKTLQSDDTYSLSFFLSSVCLLVLDTKYGDLKTPRLSLYIVGYH